MRDLFVKTDLDKNYKDATLTLDADIRNLGDDTAAGKKYTVSADLYKIDGKTKVWSEPMVIEATVRQQRKVWQRKQTIREQPLGEANK